MPKLIFLTTAMLIITVLYFINEPQHPVVYSPALLHIVDCAENGTYEIMIPPGIDAEIYSKQYCLTLTLR